MTTAATALIIGPRADLLWSLTVNVFPLLTLHPIADSRHRWVALLIAAPEPTASADLLAALAHWLGPLELRAAVGALPLVLPELAPENIAAESVAALGSGPLLLRATVSGAIGESELAAMAAACGSEARLLLCGTPRPLPLPAAVQGWTLDLGRHAADGAPPGGKGPHLALHVASGVAAQQALATGWTWLCGNYPHEAQAVPARGGSGRSVMLKLLSQITLDADDSEIEKTLKQDPNLSFQLLRLVNSAGMSGRAHITSFRQAITTLGRRQLQRWLQLLLYAQQADGPPNPLLPVAAWRAGLMEALTAAAGLDTGMQDLAFMTGMFSRLDVLFGQSLTEVLTPLGLQAPVTQALLERSGPLAPAFTLVEATEAVLDAGTDAGAGLRAALAASGLDGEAWARAQARAMQWALKICREL